MPAGNRYVRPRKDPLTPKGSVFVNRRKDPLKDHPELAEAIPGEALRDSDLITEPEEKGLPGWQGTLLTRLGVPTEEQPQRLRTGAPEPLRLSVPIPDEMMEVIRGVAERQQPPMTPQTYLQHCLALGLSKDLDEFYWVTRTRLRIEEP